VAEGRQVFRSSEMYIAAGLVSLRMLPSRGVTEMWAPCMMGPHVSYPMSPFATNMSEDPRRYLSQG
jgi:hypothetical protein